MLEIDIWADKQVSPREVEVAGIDEILGRFVDEDKREEREARRDEAISLLRDISGQDRSYPFRRGVLPPEVAKKEKRLLEVLGQKYPTCDKYGLILFGALLTGRTTPTDKQKFDEAFCGLTIRKEKSIGRVGPLSGRDGSHLEPFSQCWRVAVELEGLVGFMKEPLEELPPLGQLPSLAEDGMAELLAKRKTIQKKLEMKGFVIVAWRYLWEKFSEALREKSLALTAGDGDKEEKNLAPFVFDPSLQFTVGGEEYRAIVELVEQRVLTPLVKLVGERKGEWQSYKKTADNCSEAPERDFIGWVS